LPFKLIKCVLVPWLEAGIGAIATQASTNISFGPLGLALLEEGLELAKIVDTLVASDEDAHRRQFVVVDIEGRVAAWTGENCIAEAGHHVGEGFSVQANMMTNDTVINAMASAYSQSQGDLAERMMAALFAAQEEGGDIRGMQSAALKVVKADTEGKNIIFQRRALYDLRVDEHSEPVEELSRLTRMRKSQIINWHGHLELEDDRLSAALELLDQARVMAPELEETAFWQAVTLADKPSETQKAVEILKPMLLEDVRRDHWVDLIGRLQDCGIIERQGAGDELIQALNL
jgi:uncharacterized Ntn-hydrolase superfamily protein